MTVVTATMLRALNACADQIDLFLATFGEEAELTPENVRRAHEAGLDVVWMATYRERSEFERVWNDAYVEFVLARGVTYADYERIRDSACAEYDRVFGATEGERDSGNWEALAKRTRGTGKHWRREPSPSSRVLEVQHDAQD
jgi:hypothetical protein